MSATLEDLPLAKLSPEGFARFAQFITAELGIKMPESKLPLIQSRLMRRVRELGLASIDQYGEYFFQSPEAGEERVHLINAVTTNKTEFFREPGHFDYLVRSVLPRLRRAGREWQLRLWCAGCSSGEEPYTLAMILEEFAGANQGFDYAILATDVSTRVLERARAGIYEEQLAAPVPRHLGAKYLLRSRNGQKLVRVVPALRRKISFHRLNFMDTDYRIRDTFDVVFFRNVMIYFSRETQETVVNRICRNLASGGHLFVGHSESLAGLNVPVAPVEAAVLRKG